MKPRGVLGYPTSALGDYDLSGLRSRPGGRYRRRDRKLDPLKRSIGSCAGTNDLITGDQIPCQASLGISRSAFGNTVRQLKDLQGRLLFSDNGRLVSGLPETLLGFPIAWDDSYPSSGANALVAAFGDWKRGYLIVDRMGSRVLRDPYTSKPYVLFYCTKRVGGGVQNFEALKLLKFATS